MRGRTVAFVLSGILPALGGCSAAADEARPRKASLGAETRNPTEEEAKAYSLGRHKVGCTNGQYIKAVEKGGAADRAGLKEGDVILALDPNKLYSRDDLLDFIGVAKPEAQVTALVKHAATFKEEKVALTLGTGPEVSGKGIVWQYAGLGQFDSALAAAKKDGKLVLVGLSGADT
jgi:S1-C subfamily serine protease